MTTKVAVAPLSNVGSTAPPALCSAAMIAAGVPTGQVAVPVTVHAAAVQLRPGATGSFTTALGAFPGPRLDTVTV